MKFAVGRGPRKRDVLLRWVSIGALLAFTLLGRRAQNLNLTIAEKLGMLRGTVEPETRLESPRWPLIQDALSVMF